MRRLPYDVARCSSETCTKRGECLRVLDAGHPTQQLFSAFPDWPECESLIYATEYEE